MGRARPNFILENAQGFVEIRDDEVDEAGAQTFRGDSLRLRQHRARTAPATLAATTTRDTSGLTVRAEKLAAEGVSENARGRSSSATETDRGLR